MDPQGFLDMLFVFLEERNPESTLSPPSFDDSEVSPFMVQRIHLGPFRIMCFVHQLVFVNLNDNLADV